jgi:hypothetical protein
MGRVHVHVESCRREREKYITVTPVCLSPSREQAGEEHRWAKSRSFLPRSAIFEKKGRRTGVPKFPSGSVVRVLASSITWSR